ncbi:hypothetical protein JW960_02090 [candidate division KSB1 bacterium]|nr:hypothetical protein [candidate division KSB1 bacterium]
MRSADFGVNPGLPKLAREEVSLKLFYRMCLARYFDLGVVQASEQGRINIPVYLSLGQEAISAAMSMVIPEFQIFAQHRCHATYLTFGGDPAKLRDELLGLPTGCSGGRAGSNCLQSHEGSMTMFGHHGLIGENVPLGVGAAMGSNKPTVCFFGDGAAEEDYVFSAMAFAVTKQLPVLFVCEDNNLSILTPVKDRRSWDMTKVAAALGMPAVQFSDDPWMILHETERLSKQLPAFIDCFTCRANWHVGVGTDGPPEWDRFQLVKERLAKQGLTDQAEKIEREVQERMNKLWNA